MEYEKCYTFEPASSRPTKKRKVDPQGLQTSWARREQIYRRAWQKQKERIDETLNATNVSTVLDLTHFLDNATANPQGSSIPTAIVCTGPSAAAHQAIVQQLASKASANGRRVFISLSAAAATNLKAALKFIIQKGTSQEDGDDDDDDEGPPQSKGPKLLNYDLQILSNYVKDRNLDQIVLSIEDTEAFNSGLLSELVELLGCWYNRIPFVLLMNIATSLDFLEQRLSKPAIRYLSGQVFDVAPADEDIERVTEAMTGPDTELWIGPNLMAMMLERQSDYIQSIESLTHALQYAYMSCFYANALSIFLDDSVAFEDVPSDHFEAARNVGSFRSKSQQLCNENRHTAVKTLLDSDRALYDEIREKISTGRQALSDIKIATKVIQGLQSCFHRERTDFSKLYLQAMSNKLHQSSGVRAMLLSIRKAPSDQAVKLMEVLSTSEASKEISGRCTIMHDELRELLEKQADNTKPLRSEDDVKNSTLRTTVVAQRIELSKQKSSLSKEDAAYTALLRRFTDVLEEYFAAVLINPKDLPFHEIFLYDLKSPSREVFTPRPRHAIERALDTPHDYLVCDCCGPEKDNGDDAALASTQPATSILYQLYLESGSLINVNDLWQAFLAVMGGESREEENMALFQRALAELQHLNMVRSTRKKTDHVAKVAWKGL